jgi:hypothetical protein
LAVSRATSSAQCGPPKLLQYHRSMNTRAHSAASVLRPCSAWLSRPMTS